MRCGEEKVRVMRILIYEGTRGWVEETLKRSLVPLDGIKVIQKNCIKSALIDKFPEILGELDSCKKTLKEELDLCKSALEVAAEGSHYCEGIVAVGQNREKEKEDWIKTRIEDCLAGAERRRKREKEENK